ncbi:amidohydrolase family protein [Chloroflexota bacterium]
MIIDFEHHIYLPEQCVPKKSQSGKITERHWEDKDKLRIRIFNDASNIERFIQFMDDAGIDMAVLTTNNFSGGLAQMKRWNTFCAEILKKYPERFRGFACIAPMEGQAALDEIDRAVNDLGMIGVHIWTRNNGRHLDDRDMWPFYEKCAKFKLPVDVHVTIEPDGLDVMKSRYGLSYVLAREFDMAVATLRVCLGGILEDFPELKFIMNHFGGGVSSVVDRLEAYMEFLGSGWEKFYLDEPLISKPWKHYWDKLYFNVAGRETGTNSLKCALTNIKPEKLVFGTDWPFNYDYRPEKVRQFVEEIRNLDLPAGAAEGILGDNAARILGLK